MKTTTLNKIYSFGPCTSGWRKLLRGLGKTAPDDEPLPYSDILRTNGAGDALWSVRCAERDDIIDLACRYAESVAHLTSDPRAAEAVRVARGVIAGTHTPEQAHYAGWASLVRDPTPADKATEAAFDAAGAAKVVCDGTGFTAEARAGRARMSHACVAARSARIASGDNTLRERVFLEWANS